MNGEGQILAWLEQVQLLVEQKPVRAEVNELLAAGDALDDLIDLLVEKRLASRYGNNGRAALVHGRETILDAQALIQNGIFIVDLAAPWAGKVASE